ncbi:MAG TPA: DEAD/DEAH box helicase [Pelomicrobium sp.]|nr:DEAD/DEAH box helicase [Pelomicrobium sp.]
MKFAELGLIPELLQAVDEQGYTQPTPVQEQAIPLVLAGRDVMAAAQTGTGKTAAFTLPILQRLAPLASTSTSPARHPVRVLVLVPTRELALQVEESVRAYGKHVPLRYAVVYGGVSIDPQIEQLRRGVEIVVATPGRLLDHLHQRTINLSQVSILVLDEADRMLDMGFMPDIKRILAVLPAKRQNLMFSATFADEVVRLSSSILSAPVRIQVAARNAPADLVRQVVHPVDASLKKDLLEHLLETRGMQQVLVFTATRLAANRLARMLVRDGVNAEALHSDRTQQQRLQALNDFKDGKVRVLVATDIAGRGLDIEELPHVINYELPSNPEDYVHRIGRTGRAGMEGDAHSLVSPEEEKLLAGIERLLKRSIPREAVEGFEPGARRPRREGRGGHERRRERRPDRDERRPAREESVERAEAEAPETLEPSPPPPPRRPLPPPDAAGTTAHRPRHRTSRPVPALLGGGSTKKD